MSKAIETHQIEEHYRSLPGSELRALRGTSSKVFDLGKGRRQAFSYGEPVHFLCDGSI